MLSYLLSVLHEVQADKVTPDLLGRACSSLFSCARSLLAPLVRRVSELVALQLIRRIDGQRVEVTILGLADNEKVDESGARGGFFPFSAATVTVRRASTFTEEFLDGSLSINQIRKARYGLPAEFERLFLKLCHDIWMTKDLAIRGRVVVIE